jgi:regulator of PEP synthase PpsR (kinase-PPPase family)
MHPPKRIVQIRQNRLLGPKAHRSDDKYIDQQSVAEGAAALRRLCTNGFSNKD